MSSDRPVPGLCLMLAFCVLAPLGDAMAKLATLSLPIYAIVLARFGMQAVLLGPTGLVHGLPRLPAHFWALLGVRTVLHLGGVWMMFVALSYLPLAEAIAIAYVMPFFALLLGWLCLGESVGPRRLAACVAGFAGTLLVVQPSFAALGWPALLPVGVAILFAAFMLATRVATRMLDPLRLQALSGILGTSILLGLGVVLPGLTAAHDALRSLDASAALLLLGVGVVGSLAHLALTWALRLAPSATLAPLQYLEIPFATLLGWAVFAQLPDPLAAVGIAVTLGAGLYVLRRERHLARVAATP